jgi:hypothetical protein
MKTKITVEIELDQPRRGAKPDEVTVTCNGKKIRSAEISDDLGASEIRFPVVDGHDWFLGVTLIDL